MQWQKAVHDGCSLWRAIHLGCPDVQVVAVNDTADPALIAHLLRYDSVRGRFPGTVRCLGDAIEVIGIRAGERPRREQSAQSDQGADRDPGECRVARSAARLGRPPSR